jgi:hypothetical protein
VDDFMARPTDELVSYLAERPTNSRGRDAFMLRMGRIAMAMEIMTVVKVLEEHQLLAEHEQMISVLKTLIVDQDLSVDAEQWYEYLSEWRKLKLVPVELGYVQPSDAGPIHDAQPSDAGTPRGTQPPHGSTDAPHGSGRTTDLPSSDSPL